MIIIIVIIIIVYNRAPPGYGLAMERLWGGYRAMGGYLCIVLGYKLAMGWLWAGYGDTAA